MALAARGTIIEIRSVKRKILVFIVYHPSDLLTKCKFMTVDQQHNASGIEIPFIMARGS
jgi:hypothetical protein